MILLDRWKIRVHLRADEGTPAPEEDDGALEITALSWRQALIIGFMQTIAMIPGTSRSMMTITAGVLVGLKPKQAAEFSFLLGLPTLGGACVYSLLKNLKESSEAGVPNMFEVIGWGPILAGFAVATVSAAFAVRWLVGFLNRHGLEAFGWYRIALSLVLGGLMLLGFVSIGTEGVIDG
ncbi:MAG: undecaprenyl-diphosphate phosphatase, partial [Phycisphaerales bacterium JB059]